jgi:hypothetical protein
VGYLGGLDLDRAVMSIKAMFNEPAGA